MSEPEYYTTTMHDFKTNFSRYTRWLEEGRYTGVCVKRYNTVIGMYFAKPKGGDWSDLYGQYKGDV